jgi:hypothetical protein
MLNSLTNTINNSSSHINFLNESHHLIYLKKDDGNLTKVIPFWIKTPYRIDDSSSTLEKSSVSSDYHPLIRNTEETKQIDIHYSINLQAQNYLNNLYSLKVSDAELLGYLFEEIEKSFAKHDLLFVDAVLANFDPTRTKTIISTGLLRVTSRAKKKLNSWMPCAAHINNYLNSCGENSKRLLRGLIKFDNAITISSSTIS